MTYRANTDAIGFTSLPEDVEVHRYGHNAMASKFELILPNVDGSFAEGVAAEAFEEIDRLELELSRFVESSDISQINDRGAAEPVPVGLAALECLQAAVALHRETRGAFDITLGALLPGKHWEEEDWPAPPPELPKHEPTLFDGLDGGGGVSGMDAIRIDPEGKTVALGADGIELDLGGIGKGYAIDQVVKLLRDWSVDHALVHAGESSVFAVGTVPGDDAWPLALRDPAAPERTAGAARVRDQSVSGSGLLRRGHHIIDPSSGGAAWGRLGAWSLASSATVSDALSTALMLMGSDPINRLCEARPDVGALVLDETPEGRHAQPFGRWNQVAVQGERE